MMADEPEVTTTDVDAPDDAQPEKPLLPVGDDHAAVDPATGELHPYYCPGCGQGYPYPAQCVGTPTAPHPAIQTVDSDELHGEPDEHTAAPTSE